MLRLYKDQIEVENQFKKRKRFHPTGVSVLEMLDEVTTVWIGDGDSRQRMTARPHDEQIERVFSTFAAGSIRADSAHIRAMPKSRPMRLDIEFVLLLCRA